MDQTTAIYIIGACIGLFALGCSAISYAFAEA